MSKIVYRCDTAKCDECYEDCHYTADIKHALNFEYLEDVDVYREAQKNEPCYISTRFEPYCKGCEFFEPYSYTNDIYANDQRIIVECVLTCENWKDCRRLAERLKTCSMD